MREVTGDLWIVEADVVVITTNGFIKKNGHAVMGRGVAKQALDRWPEISKILGDLLRDNGNHIGIAHLGLVHTGGRTIIFFPVKHNWFEKADLALITRSTRELVKLADRTGLHDVALPRPGCGNGKLNWEYVKPILDLYLDDRFIVVNLT